MRVVMVKLAEEKNFRQRLFIIPDISTYVPTSTPSPCFQYNSALFRSGVVYVSFVLFFHYSVLLLTRTLLSSTLHRHILCPRPPFDLPSPPDTV